MQKYFRNDKGLSLIEVLASLVILGIVFVGFMTIFPQMTLFNKKTEIKLETMNLAREEIALIKNKKEPYVSPLNQNDINAIILGTNETVIKNPVDLSKNALRINYEKNDYIYEADFYTDPVPDLDSKIHPENIILYKVHLKVLADGKINSESYGYIEAKIVK
ncbi:type II secretion system protein [Sporosarcina sp. Marseille-Q4063]|uniref:type IV pilus modification PilV family protein n=1 Tax=Sporosarcina sp. Marseille-Q4063 TaxID=2810514 RepID=UPI001BAE976F|nr:type II secretion system protein [Sporosarcina sp. Marseille-Q4063]QUW22514.1 type II secretion system protein [Sporosarcina sp. Marseille-Q4063]